MNEILNDFTVVEEMPVRWGDMDARGHVNNTIYYRYFESSRITLFRFLNIYEEPTKVRVGPILSFQSCYYKAPLTYPDTIYVGAKIISIEGSKIIIKHILVSKKLERKVAEGEAHIIWYDYENQKKANISDELKQRLLNSKNKEIKS
ncbi:MAG: acyl-CoA thioesterase [Promethearchaeota archaeon]|nr:MAG: acyl-CoA thioesterase [Candidatus Lokiarchaeota archaeon]